MHVFSTKVNSDTWGLEEKKGGMIEGSEGKKACFACFPCSVNLESIPKGK